MATQLELTYLTYTQPDSPKGKFYVAAWDYRADVGYTRWGAGTAPAGSPGQIKLFSSRAELSKKVNEKTWNGYQQQDRWVYQDPAPRGIPLLTNGTNTSKAMAFEVEMRSAANGRPTEKKGPLLQWNEGQPKEKVLNLEPDTGITELPAALERRIDRAVGLLDSDRTNALAELLLIREELSNVENALITVRTKYDLANRIASRG